MLYKACRNWENVEKAVYSLGENTFDIPRIAPVYKCDVENWIGFNYARGCAKEERLQHGVHFYVDDYQFHRVWQDPDRYGEMLRGFGAVMSPDFSMYTDFPKAVQIFNSYRNHWLACRWQELGVTVIPTILWSDRASFEYCFDGDPQFGVVSVSSVGTQDSRAGREAFLDGYREMMRRLHPCKIIFHGTVPDECEGNIVQITTFQDMLKKRCREAKQGGQR